MNQANVERTRISAGNIVTKIVNKDTGKSNFLGLINKKALEEKGQRLYTAIGGAAELTESGKEKLKTDLHAVFDNEDSLDARFTVPNSKVDETLSLFKKRDPEFAEIDPKREIMEELCTKELPLQDSPILNPEEAESIEIKHAATLRQASPKSGKGTSARESDSNPSRRIFNVFDMLVPSAVFDKIINSPAIKIFTGEEMKTIEGGATKGLAADGATIGDNMLHPEIK
jgi:hypothetical protein